MTIRILPAVGDVDSARALATLLSQLADAEPAPPSPTRRRSSTPWRGSPPSPSTSCPKWSWSTNA